MRIESEGRVILANAGSLAPYLNGVEVSMEGLLPLGTILGAGFSTSHFQIGNGYSLMLISDGILEAQGKEGHLFGSGRVSEPLRTKSVCVRPCYRSSDLWPGR